MLPSRRYRSRKEVAASVFALEEAPDDRIVCDEVLLGEGYYADRTSKQTVEILKRRGKYIESQIENLNGIIKDLKFEASFFDKTATEAAAPWSNERSLENKELNAIIGAWFTLCRD
ncbi:RNA polymerase II subunit 5-mediating protein homolog isoform X1 [Tanacetum coccineum]